MNCLCCGKALNNGGIDGWHKNCIKKFFGTNELPEIDINKSLIENIIAFSFFRFKSSYIVSNPCVSRLPRCYEKEKAL